MIAKVRTAPARPAAFAMLPAGAAAAAAGACGWPWGWPAAAGAATAVTGATAALLAAAWKQEAARGQRIADERANLRDLIHKDPLTGLVNRSAFHQALEQVDPIEDGVVIILFFDLDRFKEVNDTLGHKAGDDLLVQVAGRVAAALPTASTIARLGGDEFAAILPWHYQHQPDTWGYAVIDALTPAFTLGERQVEIGASVGIAVGDTKTTGGIELLRRADIAMYAAKASDGNRCRVFDDALDLHQSRESSVRIEVGKAMVEDMFHLHYQPLINARSGMFESAEALLRSRAPGLRDVSPAVLISTAEASGQIHALTDWSIGEVLKAAARIASHPVAVNISPVYFRQTDFVHKILDRLLLARARPETLILEVTEGVLIDNIEAARQSLSRLREVGIKIHLDDFGTGYSSLGYIQHFELDGLKLDKSFLRNIADKRKTNQIIRSMIDFGHSLDMSVIVEGVETEWQARLLQLLGADVLQGYQFAMPMPLDDLVRFCLTHSEFPLLSERIAPDPIGLAVSG